VIHRFAEKIETVPAKIRRLIGQRIENLFKCPAGHVHLNDDPLYDNSNIGSAGRNMDMGFKALGSIAGINEGKPIDRILSVMGGIFVSIPTFASGIFMIVIFALWLGWFPGASVPDPEDTLGEFLIKLALPILALALDEIGYLTRLMRVSTAEVMDSDYVRTAVLKGVPKVKVIRRHALRNAMIAPFTAIMLHVNWLIGGVVVVEVLFNYPGLGSLLLEAALRNDIILLMGGTLVLTFVAVASQAIADIGVYYINPRLAHS